MAERSTAPQSRRPRDTPFYQQRIKAWQPILTPKWVVISFLLLGIPFVGIGIWLKAASDNVVEYRVQYDGAGADASTLPCQLPSGNYSAACTVSIVTDRDMSPPVYLYYELHNFYQNHRRYVKSKSDPQLAGTMFTDSGSLSDCDPLRTPPGNSTRVLDPCGLIANSYFNDTFTLLPSSSGISVDETDISWSADRKKFVAPGPGAWGQYHNRVVFINETYPNLADVTNEHFIVWMRPAALPNFRKLYGHIDTTIPANTTLTFQIAANFGVAGFNGKKALVLSTTSVIGGKNPFLGIAYICVGAVAITLAMVFAVRSQLGGRRLGDTSYLVWTGNRR